MSELQRTIEAIENMKAKIYQCPECRGHFFSGHFCVGPPKGASTWTEAANDAKEGHRPWRVRTSAENPNS